MKDKRNPQGIEPGSEVCYSKRFLRSIGAGPTDPQWRLRGQVESLDELGATILLAIVRWGNGTSSRVNVANLARWGWSTARDADLYLDTKGRLRGHAIDPS